MIVRGGREVGMEAKVGTNCQRFCELQRLVVVKSYGGWFGNENSCGHAHKIRKWLFARYCC